MVEKTLCLCRKPGPSSGNPAKGKEVMNKASEEARFLGGGPERSRIRLRLRACCHPTACLKKCISRGDYPFSKRRRAGLPLFCRPTTVAAPEENATKGKQNKKLFSARGKRVHLHNKRETCRYRRRIISSPSLAGQTETVNQAGLLASACAPRTFPCSRTVAFPVRWLLQWRDRAGL